MFTNINAAIEEARFLRLLTRHHHCIHQKRDGTLSVRQEIGAAREKRLRKLYTTRQDRFGTVNTVEVT